MRQPISTMPIKGDATIVSTGRCKQLVTTTVADSIVSYSSSRCPLVLPGKPVVTAFVNRYLNSEDVCTVAKGWAESCKMLWIGRINYQLPSKVPYVQTLKNQVWWKPAITGMVVEIKMSKTGTHYIIVDLSANSIMLGDKIATAHGLKFTVGEILDEDEMP